MLGTFHNDQPKIEIEVKGMSDTAKRVTALVDSGFNGYLTLPYEEAFPLGLILIGIQSNTLADGSSSSHFVCMGQVCVDGKCISTRLKSWIVPNHIGKCFLCFARVRVRCFYGCPKRESLKW